MNRLAKSVGCCYPFPKAEILPADTGERFFSEYMSTLKNIGKKRGVDGECLCSLCDRPMPQSNNNSQTNVPSQQQQGLTTRGETMTTTTTQQSTTPPTAAKHRQQPPNVRHTHAVGAPVVTPQAQQINQLLQIAPQPQPMLLPYWCFPPMIMTPAPACCWKYKEWLSRPQRIGRPPHHPLCSGK